MQPTGYGSTSSSSYADRLRGALMLDPRTYRDIEQDTGANGQAALTVILAALAGGISALLTQDAIRNGLTIAVSSVVMWIVFSFVAYFVGTTIFATPQTSVTPGQVLRTLGFAQAPNLLLVLAIIPLLGWIVGLIAFIWFVMASITALREAFEFDAGRAIGTGLVAIIAFLFVGVILGVFFGVGSALFGALGAAVRGVF